MLTQTVPPAGEPVALADIKAALRIDHDADDTLILSMARTARAFLERRLDIALLRQEWRLELVSPPCGPEVLRPGKVVALTGGSVTYGGISRPLEPEEYRLRRSVPAAVLFDLPPGEAGEPFESLSLGFTAGWADASAVPEELIQALLLLTAHYYEEREVFVRGRYVPLPAGLQAHVQAFREVRL